MFLKKFLYHFLFFAILVPSILTAETVDLGGPRSVSVELSGDNLHWQVNVQFLPIQCFTTTLNQQLTRNKAKNYALVALSRVLNSDQYYIKSCVYQDEQYTQKFYHAKLKIELQKVSKYEAGTSIAESVSKDKFTGDLLSRKNDCSDTIVSFGNTFLEFMEKEQPAIIEKSYEDAVFKIAELEDSWDANQKKLKEEINSDIFLLEMEKEELLKILAGYDTKVLTHLKNLDNLLQKFSCIKLRDVAFRSVLMNDIPFMQRGGVKHEQNGKSQIILVAVGMTEVKGDTPKERLQQEKTAKFLALRSLQELKGTNVEVTTQTKEATQLISDTKGSFQQQEKEEFREAIVEQLEGHIYSVPVIATWYNRERTLFYVAIGKIYEFENKNR